MTKKGSASPVGLYIKLGPDYAMDILTKDLKQIALVINHDKHKRNMHAIELAVNEDDEEFKDKAKALTGFAKHNGIAVVLRGHPELAQEIEAEGVLLEDWDLLDAAREIFGHDKGLIGLYCENDPDKSAAAFDADVDFVSFGMKKGGLPAVEALKFWNMLTPKPAVVEGPVTNDHAAYYIENGAGFLSAADYIWSHPKGVMQGTVNMLHAIELALEEKNADNAASKN